MTAIILPALVGAAGLAADFTLLTRHTSVLQNAVDSAALRAAKELKIASADTTHINDVATAFVKANVTSYISSNLKISATVLT